MEARILLDQDEMPKAWYNLAADLPHAPLPPLGPDGSPVGPDQLSAVFPMNLIEQEMSSDRWIDIPEEVRAILYRWRPSPLHRAFGLEKALASTTRTRASRRRAATSRTPPSRRPTTTRSPASRS